LIAAERIVVSCRYRDSAGLKTLAGGDQTRQRILEKAAALFNQHGYAGTPFSKLMAATGLQKGGLYRHFANKEELATEAFRYAWAMTIARRSAGLSECTSSTDLLRRMVANFVHAPRELPGGCPLANTAIDADDGNPELLRLAQEALREWRGVIEKAVKKGQRVSEIRSEVSAAEVARTLIGGLEGALMISRIENHRAALLEAETRLNLFIDSLET
jgi:TetR/AcrR family transcriptional regulator, transcriptional repressor for nem operon